MSLKITYFVHGTTADNEKGVASGWSDVPLSALEIEQANKLKDTLKGRQFDLVFCSDLSRAVQTADTVFGNFKIDARLRECNYGNLSGADSKKVESLEVSCIDTPFPNGESYKQVEERMRDFLIYLRQNFDGKHIAIVAHKAPQLALEVLLNGKTWKQAFEEDWRKKKEWQPGWEYELK